MYPPSSSTGAWKYVAGLTERKKAENTTLHMEIEVSSMKAWFYVSSSFFSLTVGLFRQTLRGPFSTVSKPTFAKKD